LFCQQQQQQQPLNDAQTASARLATKRRNKERQVDRETEVANTARRWPTIQHCCGHGDKDRVTEWCGDGDDRTTHVESVLLLLLSS